MFFSTRRFISYSLFAFSNINQHKLWGTKHIHQTTVTPTKSIFKPKRDMPFVILEPINKELKRLENLGVLSKVEYADWTSPTVYVKEKNHKIRACADFQLI